MRKEITSIAIIGLFCLVSILPSVGASSADDDVVKPLNMGDAITVDDDGVDCPGAMFTELYDAIIYFRDFPYYTGIDVYPGEYKVKSSNEQHYIFSSNLIIRGVEGALKTTIDGNDIGVSLCICGSNIEVSGFTIKNQEYDGLVVAGDDEYYPNNIKIHDNIFYLKGCYFTYYGLSLEGQYGNIEIYNNDFVSDGEDSGDQQNARDVQGTGYWHDNFWREWDGVWDGTQPGEPYVKNGVVDSSPNQEPYVLGRPVVSSITQRKVMGRTYEYTISASDSDGDGLYYEAKWGDDGFDWTGYPGDYPEDGYLPQDQPLIAKHKFNIGQKRMIAVDLCDEHFLWTRQPAVLKLSYDRGMFSLFFEKLVENFPILNKLLHLS